jgi:branched-chain amino acid aminotransferase
LSIGNFSNWRAWYIHDSLLDTPESVCYILFVVAIVRTLTPDGLIDGPYEADSISEAARIEPDGVYDVTRTYPGGRAFSLETNFDRLVRSAKLAGIISGWERIKVREAIRKLLSESGYDTARLRLTVPRQHPDRVIIVLEPLSNFVADIDRLRSLGVPVATYRIDRSHPLAKTTAWVKQRNMARENLADDIYEGIILNTTGKLLEGFSSNFYAIMDGELRTAGSDVLPGLAREVVLQVAPELIPLRLDPVNIRDLDRVDESFLTSSSRGVIPIIRIDNTVIQDGKPGEITSRITNAYTAWVDSHVEEI